jgi:nucleoside-diphosphate-sugar epimerase
MRVLLTGASSFSGYWFAAKLHAIGIEVVAPLRGRTSAYSGLRGERVRNLDKVARIVSECPFGSSSFIDLIVTQKFDVLCHHAARVTDYRSIDFDVLAALAENTLNIRDIIPQMLGNGLKAVVLTGSIFEANEGAGNVPLQAFSPYGLSKGLTSEVVRYWCTHYAVPLSKFIIANPFGPLEEPRFCAYLIKTWKNNEVAEVITPDYLRDNIHVDLLALSYAQFVKRVAKLKISEKFGPIGYAETQGAFAERFADAMRVRLDWQCATRRLKQTDFAEPLARINTHPIDGSALGWSESAAWDAIAEYYGRR